MQHRRRRRRRRRLSSSSSSSPSAKEWAYLARFFNWKVEAARDATIGTSS